MSLKKTWFSYVLWFVFAVTTALISYSVLDEVLQGVYSAFYFYKPVYNLYLNIGSKAAIIAIVIMLVVLIHFVCGKVKVYSLPKWAGIILHIAIGLGMVAGFCVLRYPAFNYAYYLQSYSRAPTEQVMYFFELSKVGPVVNDAAMSVFEQVYVGAIRTLFMFFGNKAEVLLLAQLVMQALTFILLIVIGKTFQKGIFGWIPALLYAVAPTCFYTASDAGITNFWTLIIVFGLFVICLLEKIWKKKNITYLVIVIVQLLFALFIFLTKRNVLLYAGIPFVSGGITPGMAEVLDIEMLLLVAFMLAYCVSYFMDKQDHRSLFILPFIGYGFLAVWLSNYEYESSYCMMAFAIINLFFLISQSLRVIFRAKPEIVTGKNKPIESTAEADQAVVSEIPDEREGEMKPAQFEWDEMKEVMHSTEGIEVRKEEPVKVELPINEFPVEEKKIVEEPQVTVVDRKAPIENVLPMPKKHKPKVLEYAFEPTEDMMHYDIEIEDDDYDY